MEPESTKHRLNHEDLITGSLAVFLWVGIGLVMVLSAINLYNEFFQTTVRYNAFFYIERGVQFIASAIISVRTFLAFYQRKENALPLAYSFLILCLVDVVSNAIMGVLLQMPNILAGSLFVLLWAIVFYCILKFSTQVEERFEGIKQRWHLTEIICLFVYIICAFLNLLFFIAVMLNNNVLFTPRSNIEQQLEAANSELPSVINDGLIMKQGKLEGDTVVFVCKFVQMSGDSIQKNLQHKNHLLALKQVVLYSFACSRDEDLDFFTMCTNNGFHIRYQYLEQYDRLVYSIHVTPEEYKQTRVLRTNFRCDSLSWIAALEQERGELPLTLLDDLRLKEVSADYEARKLEMVI